MEHINLLASEAAGVRDVEEGAREMMFDAIEDGEARAATPPSWRGTLRRSDAAALIPEDIVGEGGRTADTTTTNSKLYKDKVGVYVDVSVLGFRLSCELRVANCSVDVIHM